jgi:hypothetical protein
MLQSPRFPGLGRRADVLIYGPALVSPKGEEVVSGLEWIEA